MFQLMFSNVSVMLVYMLAGYLICKAKKADVSHTKSVSGILLYVFSPAMILNSFLQIDFTADNCKKIILSFVTTLLVQLLFIGLLVLIFGKKYKDAKYRILTAGSVLGNVGFLGMPIVSSLFPDEPIVMVYSTINVMSMNIIVFTFGVYLITNKREYVSMKSAVINPTSISILASLPFFIFQISLPEPLQNAVGILAKAVTPMCMLILGMRLSAVRLKAIFTLFFVYLTCLFKLVVFPVFALLFVKCLPFLDDTLKSTIVVLASMPSGAIIESLAEIHECEQEFSANVVLLTTIISVITIPIMTTILL